MARSVFLAMTVLLLVAAMLSADVAPARALCPPEVTIESVTYMGSGCSWENTQYVLSPDYSTMTFIFGAMIATTDGGLANQRKNCIISLGLKFPKGWSFSLGQVRVRGYAKLDAGVEGVYQTSYFLSGETGTAHIKRTLKGKAELRYKTTDFFGLLIWSKCNNYPNLNINVEVRVDGPPNRSGIMAVYSVNEKFKLSCFLNWKRC